MRMAMHIDDEFLASLMAATGATSKTKAIDLALREMDRRAKLVKLCREGLGLTPDELKEAFDPASILKETLRAAEKALTYGRKSGFRREQPLHL